MNLLSPTPFLGFNSVYRGQVTYGAFSSEIYLSGGIVTNRLQYIVSPDGLTWHDKTISGDIAGFTSSAGAGSYHAVDHIIFDGAIYSYGRIWTGDSTSVLGLFKSADGGQSFDRITTAVDGSTGSRGYVDAVVTGSTLVLLSSTGDLVYTTDGSIFSTRSNPGFTGLATSITAGTGALIAVGANGQAFTMATPGGTATARDIGFGGTSPEKVRAGNVVVVMGGGKIATAPLGDLTNWTGRTDPVGGGVDYLAYENSDWIAADINDKWLQSDTGATWAQGTSPLTGRRVRSAISESGRLLLFLSGGKLAVTEDYSAWNSDAATGLDPDRDYKGFKSP